MNNLLAQLRIAEPVRQWRYKPEFTAHFRRGKPAKILGWVSAGYEWWGDPTCKASGYARNFSLRLDLEWRSFPSKVFGRE